MKYNRIIIASTIAASGLLAACGASEGASRVAQQCRESGAFTQKICSCYGREVERRLNKAEMKLLLDMSDPAIGFSSILTEAGNPNMLEELERIGAETGQALTKCRS